MTTNGTSPERRFWLEWVIGNALGSGLGLSATWAVAIGLYVLSFATSRIEPRETFGLIFLTASSSLLFAVFGFFLGLGQWAMLNLKVRTSHSWFWLSSLAWALPGGITGYLSSGIGYPEESALATAIVGGASGFVVGFAQWLVLRKMAASAGWWLGINTAGYTIGYLIPFWLKLHETALESFALFLNIELTQIIAAAITGLGVIRILKISKSSQSVTA